jgi:hypothetical protein
LPGTEKALAAGVEADHGAVAAEFLLLRGDATMEAA